MKRICALAFLPLAGCPFATPPLEIPQDVFDRCVTLDGDPVPDLVQLVVDARNGGLNRSEAEIVFDDFCVQSQPDASFVGACMFCGDAILNFVYGAPN